MSLPGAVAGRLPAASIRRRLAAMVYDGMLLVGVWFIGFLLPNMIYGTLAGAAAPGGVAAVHAVAVIAAYFLWFWHRTGQTLAMRTWKIRLVGADDHPPGWMRLSLRFALAWPSVLCVAGLLWAVFDRDRQFLHDRLAGTRIVFVNESQPR